MVWNIPKLQAPLFIPVLFLGLGTKAVEQPQLLLVCMLAIGVLFAAKQRGFAYALLLVTGLGIARQSLNLRYHPATISSNCSVWKCSSAQAEPSSGYLCLCSSHSHPLGTLIEWNEAYPPVMHQFFLATLKPFRSNAQFNRAQWKQTQGISGELCPIPFANSSELKLIGRVQSEHIASSIARRIKHLIKRAIDQSFSGEARGFLCAIATGDKSNLDFKVKAYFSNAGLAHLLAVSGYHVGLVCFVPLMLLHTRRRFVRMFSVALIITMSWMFVAVCGWPTSGIRAATMICLYSLSCLFGRRINSIQIWAITLALMLLYNPNIATSLGAQLSFLAVLAILLFLRISSSFHRFQKIAIALGIPVAAQFGTAGIAIPTFHSFPYFFWPFNLLAQIAMTGIGVLFATWGICFGIGIRILKPLQNFCNRTLSNVISQLFDGLHLVQQNFKLAINLEQTPAFIWGIFSAIYFISALYSIQFKSKTGVIFIRLITSVLILLPWGVLVPIQRNSVVVKQYRKPVLQLHERNALHVFTFDSRDSASVRRHLILKGTTNPEITCLTPGQNWFNSQGDFMLWMSKFEAKGCIAKRPCNYRCTGEEKGTLNLGDRNIMWRSWGQNQFLIEVE